MRRAVLYLRVSTIEQMTANQERELREIAGRMGCKIVKVYKARPRFKCSTFLPSSSAASSKNVSVCWPSEGQG